MRICVCGMGKIGRPILDMLRFMEFQAVGYDADDTKSETPLAYAADATDVGIFIVQTPSLPDGSFSNEHLKCALESFAKRARRDYLYIIGSTTTPGSCDSFRSIVGENICYKPEFIRLAHVKQDLLNQSFVLIGANTSDAGDRCEEIYRRITSAPIKRMTLLEAELAKITLNCALTMKISLANQLHVVAEKMGADSQKIMEAVGSDPRIGNDYLTPGTPYGGPCLPRDNRMFRYVAESLGLTAPLSEAADTINESLKVPARIS